jgi:hypothetical protein
MMAAVRTRFSPAGPQHAHLDLVFAQFFPDARLRLPGTQPPQTRRVAQFSLPIVEPEIDRLCCLAQNDDAVETGVFHLRREEAARLRVADRARQGRPGVGGHAALPREGRAGEHAQHQRQHVVGAKRIGAGRHVLEDVVHAKVCAAHVGAIPRFVVLIDMNAGRCSG